MDHAYAIVSQQFEAERVNSVVNTLTQLGVPFSLVEPYFKDRDSDDIWKTRFRPTQEPCSIGARFLFVTFEKLYERILKDGHSRVLILESDALLLPEFKERWIDLQANLPSSGVVFLGAHLGIPSGTPSKNNLVEMGRTRCCDSMIWTRDAIQTVLPYLRGSFGDPIDHHLNRVFAAVKIPVFWLENPIIHQGSASGEFQSNLR
jgi:hypothetical protein